MVQSIVTRLMDNNERAMFTSAQSHTRLEYMYTLPTCEEQFNFFQETMDYLLGTCFPYKTVSRHNTVKLWITDGFRHLIRQRQRARMSGDMEQVRRLRNLVNRTAPKLRHQFYQSKIATLDESSTRDWWKHMKPLLGASSGSRNEMQGLANKYTDGNWDSLVNSMNVFFVSVCEDLPRLQSSHPIFDADEPLPAEFIISVTDTEVALEKMKVNKATGPDNIPLWVFSHLLAAPVTTIFNSSLREGVLPKLWKSAAVIPLSKKHPPDTEENNIIPISLIPILANGKGV